MGYILDSVEHPAGGFNLGSILYPTIDYTTEAGAYSYTGFDTALDVVSISSLRARVRFGVNIVEGNLKVYKNGVWQRTELRTS